MNVIYKIVQGAPKPIAPYSHSVVCPNGFVFITGQMPIDPASNCWVSGAISDQAVRVFENIKIILHDSGLSLNDVVQCRVFLSDMKFYNEFNTIYETIFSATKRPARTCIGVSGLAGNADVEIDVVAFSPDLIVTSN